MSNKGYSYQRSESIKKLKTYRDLLDFLITMSDQDLDQCVTIYTPSDEYIGIQSFELSDEGDNDLLDHGHLYLDGNF
jgi:hypothetical protein